METRSKAQRDAVGADTSGSGSVTGETYRRKDGRTWVASRPNLGFRATPVLADKNQEDAEQHQEHTHLRHGPEISTLRRAIRSWQFDMTHKWYKLNFWFIMQRHYNQHMEAFSHHFTIIWAVHFWSFFQCVNLQMWSYSYTHHRTCTLKGMLFRGHCLAVLRTSNPVIVH